MRLKQAIKFLLGLGAVIVLATAWARADRATPATCDLDALRIYPMREVLKTKAMPLSMPELFFSAPGPEPTGWEPADEKTRKAALARGIASFKAEERPIVLLAAIAHWTSGKDPMLNFFVLPPGSYYDEAIETLDRMGLAEHAALFREGHALFAPDYGTDQQRYHRWSDGYGTIRDVVLDARLKDLSDRYQRLSDVLDAAAARVAASPELTGIYEPTRAATADDVRLSYLASGLWNCLDHYGPPDAVGQRLAELPVAYRHIVVTFIFQAEMLNGSVEQFFYNSSGTLAPEVVLALSAMGLDKHAAAVQKGIDMFPKPYPRDLEKRRRIMAVAGNGLSEALNALTGNVDDGAMEPAMIRTAREAGILPK